MIHGRSVHSQWQKKIDKRFLTCAGYHRDCTRPPPPTKHHCSAAGGRVYLLGEIVLLSEYADMMPEFEEGKKTK